MAAFADAAKWWIYRNEEGTWDVSAPSFGYQWPGVTEFMTGAEALATFAQGGSR
jgi:hypothetical protein